MLMINGLLDIPLSLAADSLLKNAVCFLSDSVAVTSFSSHLSEHFVCVTASRSTSKVKKLIDECADIA